MKTHAIFALFAATLCAQAPAPSSAPGAPPGPSPVGIAPDTVVAKVDGRDVTAGEVKQLETIDPQFAQAYKQNPALTIRDYFAIRFLSEEADKLKLAEQSPWKEQIELQRVRMMANAMINHERDSFGIATEDIEAYYKREQPRFEQAKIKIILISFKPPIPSGTSPDAVKAAAQAIVEAAHAQHSEEEAKTLAAEVVKKARAGSDFSELVKQYSEDNVSKSAGGDFGWVKSNSSYPVELKRAVFALKAGDISDPVRQPSAFYVIRCEEKSVQPLSEVREVIVQEIRQAHLGDFIKSLQLRFTPKIERPDFFQSSAAAVPVIPGNPPAPSKP